MIRLVSRIGLAVVVSLVTLLTNSVLSPLQVTAPSAAAYPSDGGLSGKRCRAQCR